MQLFELKKTQYSIAQTWYPISNPRFIAGLKPNAFTVQLTIKIFFMIIFRVKDKVTMFLSCGVYETILQKLSEHSTYTQPIQYL